MNKVPEPFGVHALLQGPAETAEYIAQVPSTSCRLHGDVPMQTLPSESTHCSKMLAWEGVAFK